MMNYLGKHIQYPERAKQTKTTGTVMLELYIEKDGAVSEVRELKKSAPRQEDLVAEAIRVVSGMPRWMPAQAGGVAVRAKFVLPIKFKLE